MSVFYIDVTGRRNWSDFRAGQDWLLPNVAPTAQDVVFIHLSDFVHAVCNFHSGIPTENWGPLRERTQMIAATASSGSEIPWLVFISGESDDSSELRTHEEKIWETLGRGQQRRIGFWPNIHRGLTGIQLELLFGSLVDRLPTALSCQECIDGLTHDRKADEEKILVEEALRILWQVFLLAKYRPKHPEDLPQGLCKTHGLLQGKTFTNEYWAPVLEDGRLREELRQSDDEEVQEIVSVLQDTKTWDSVQMPEGVIEQSFSSWKRRFAAASQKKRSN